MKYLKVIVGLGLIPLGVFVGSFISIGEGNGAVLGAHSWCDSVLHTFLVFLATLARLSQSGRTVPGQQ